MSRFVKFKKQCFPRDKALKDYAGSYSDVSSDGSINADVNSDMSRRRSPGPIPSISSPLLDGREELYTYEHFPIVCPTCQGTGKLPEDEANGLVALVPFGDERLKPSHLKKKMMIVFIIALIIGGLSLAFLYPRHVEIMIGDCLPSNFSFPKEGDALVMMKVKLHFVNHNFFPVDISNVKAQIFLREFALPHELGSNSSTWTSSLGIKGENTVQADVLTIFTRSSTAYDLIRIMCKEARQTMFEEAIVTASVHYWLHSEEITAQRYFYVDCEKFVFPWIRK